MALFDRIALTLALGFYIGRIPWAPGTFGSVLGLGWFAVLVATGSVWVFVSGMIFGIIVSVWACGRAERILGVTDPGCVVLDEIVAIPIAGFGWVSLESVRLGRWPGPIEMMEGDRWILWVVLFGLFRLFDIWKPWPIRELQKLHGGWGVTADDLLAAWYVNLILVWWI